MNPTDEQDWEIMFFDLMYMRWSERFLNPCSGLEKKCWSLLCTIFLCIWDLFMFHIFNRLKKKMANHILPKTWFSVTQSRFQKNFNAPWSELRDNRLPELLYVGLQARTSWQHFSKSTLFTEEMLSKTYLKWFFLLFSFSCCCSVPFLFPFLHAKDVQKK